MVLLFSVEFVVVPSGCWGLRQRFQVLSGPSEAFLLPSRMCWAFSVLGGVAAGVGVSTSVLGALRRPS